MDPRGDRAFDQRCGVRYYRRGMLVDYALAPKARLLKISERPASLAALWPASRLTADWFTRGSTWLSIVRSADPNEPDDPILEAIGRHRRAAAIWSAAVHREFELEGKSDALFAEAQRIERKARADRDDATCDLVLIGPTTVACIIALLRYYEQAQRSTGAPFGPIILTSATKNTRRPSCAMQPLRWRE